MLIQSTFVAALVSTALAASSNAQVAATKQSEATVSGKPLSLKLATQIADAALKACGDRGYPITVVVYDEAGNMRVLLTGDNARTSGFNTASHKAAAVLAFGVSSKDLAARIESDAAFASKYGNDSRYNFHDGAVPLYKQGKLIGVLALGGAHGVDDLCAHEALAAARELSSARK